LAIAAAGCRKPAAPIERPVPLVTVAQALTQDVPVYIDEIGMCTALEVVSISPQATGKIVGQYVEDGDDVRKGQKLFTIDPQPYQAALDQAKASLDQAKAAVAQNEASLLLATLELTRSETLYPLKATSKEDLETKQNAVAVAKAQIQAAQAQIQAGKAAIETAQVNLDYCFITSPLDGRAGKVLIDPGNAVTANSTAVLIVLQKLDPIYADFTVPERDLDRVRQNMAAGTLKTLIRLPTEPLDKAREGDLTFLDNAVQQSTGTIALRATIHNTDRRFWPGQFVQVRLVLKTQRGAVLVPYPATQVSQNGAYVYVVAPDSTAAIRPVTLGQRQGDLVVVTDGLKAGESIVTSGQMLIVPGGKVRVAPPQTQPSSASSQPAAQSQPAALGAMPKSARACPHDVGMIAPRAHARADLGMAPLKALDLSLGMGLRPGGA
jgi:multidrug efflux system membrane fusion protein